MTSFYRSIAFTFIFTNSLTYALTTVPQNGGAFPSAEYLRKRNILMPRSYMADSPEAINSKAILEGYANEKRDVCSAIDCMEEGDGKCGTQGCVVCGADYYCVDHDELISSAPHVDQLLFLDDASDASNVPLIPTNFMETGNFDNLWSKPVCEVATVVASDQIEQGGMFTYNVQATHKEGITLIHKGKMLSLLVTWQPTDKTFLPLYDKVDLCRRGIHEAAQSYHELKYGAFNLQTAFSVKNTHDIQIQLPTSRIGKAGRTIATMRIEIRDRNDDIEVFGGDGQPTK